MKTTTLGEILAAIAAVMLLVAVFSSVTTGEAPVRLAEPIKLAKNPVAFWLTVTIYFAASVCCSLLALGLL